MPAIHKFRKNIKKNSKPTSLPMRSKITLTIINFLASKWFFVGLLLLFIAQASYVALTGAYSMAFDEYYHLATIKQYTDVLAPWSVQQPAGPAVFGSVQTDGSYLYHYLMSFPYRLLSLLTDSETVRIIWMRLFDVGLVAAGLVVFRRLLVRVLGMGKSAAHILLFIVTLLPMTPFLAGQLTYDAALFVATAVSLCVFIRFIQVISYEHRVHFPYLIATLSMILITSQLKYAFLPMGLAMGIIILVLAVVHFRRRTIAGSEVVRDVSASLRSPKTWLLIAILVLSAALFAARYGTNVVRYSSPTPECGVVLSHERCRAYGPYGRDAKYRDHGLHLQIDSQDKLYYPIGWFKQMIRETYFTVGPMEIGYPTGKPLPVSYFAGWVAAVGVMGIIAARIRFIWRSGVVVRSMCIVMLMYVGFLFAKNYANYLGTGVPVAIHGRYVLHLLPILGWVFYVAVRPWWNSASTRIKTSILIALVCFTMLTIYGGGIMPFIIRSSDAWYWQHAVDVSRAVRSFWWHLILK